MVGLLLAIAAGLCWGIGEVFTKSVLHTGKIGPITAITVRSTVALPVLWIAYVAALHVFRSRTEPPEWWKAETSILLRLILGSGLIAGALAMICFYASMSLEPITKVKPIAFTIAPATAVLTGYFVLGEPMSVRKWIAITLIIGGVVLLTSSPRTEASANAQPAATS